MNTILIIYNARIYTQDQKLPLASALAIDIQSGQIIEVGQDDVLFSELIGKVDKYDAQNRIVIPGLTDAHIHLQQYALGLEKIDCETTTRHECLLRVKQLALNSTPGKWILGHGWNHNNWLEGIGNASMLDEVSPNNPVYLTAKSLHAAWVNSRALEEAGISYETTDPSGGRISRNQEGKPDGILFETSMRFVKDVIPEPSVDHIVNAIGNAQSTLWRMGLTGVHDFDSLSCYYALQILYEHGKLGLRVLKSIPLEELLPAVEIGLHSGFGDDRLRVGPLKLFADGALGPRTAAMIEPYEKEQDNLGMLMMDADELYVHAQTAINHDFNLAVHAIGDRANQEVLNAFTKLRGRSSIKEGPTMGVDLRHRIEHVQLLHPQDSKRLAQLGIIASMQPIHAISDMEMANRFWGERAAYSYAWKELLRQGSILTFGSDAPVESPNPFFGFHAAVTRRRADGSPGPNGWYPEQRINVNEALNGYTTSPAYAAGMETRLGKLAPGYLADLIILDEDPFIIDPDQLRFIKPVATMISGKWVWRSTKLA